MSASLLKDPALKQAPRERFPRFVAPELATLSDQAPKGPGWIHEIKLDGYRLLCRYSKGKIQLLTRKGNDWTAKLNSVAELFSGLNCQEAIFDGELTVVLPNGKTDFQALQNSLKHDRTGSMSFFVFDLLHLDGRDLRGLPLLERKRLLRKVLGRRKRNGLIFSEHFESPGGEVLQNACNLGLEGIISKRSDSSYVGGRTKEWIKTKCIGREEFVIGGFTFFTDTRNQIGALLLGAYLADSHECVYCGKVGTGFNHESRRELFDSLSPLEADTSPFSNYHPKRARGIHWVKPRLVAEVQFTEWTSEGMLRHPSFLALREDKKAKDVIHAPETTANPLAR